jgi:heptosyltransferase-2
MAEPAHGVARPEDEPRAMLVKAVNWLGDLVMSLPALRAVRAAHPTSRLVVLVRRELASFYDGAGWIDEVLPYDRAPGLSRLARAWRLARAIRARGVELAVLFPTSFESALWPALARVPRRVGYSGDARTPLLTTALTPPPEIRAAHEVHWYLDLVHRTLGVAGAPDDVVPDVHPPHRERMRAWLGSHGVAPGTRLVALAPGAAYGPAKEWPAARYAALIDLVAERAGARAVLMGAPNERARCEEVAATARAGALVAAGETSVGELVALLSLCAGFAGNDSGAMHVAGALGLPTIGIFGSTSPERTGPCGPRARVVYERIECSPCLDRTCRFGTYACFDPTTPERVAAELDALGAFRA